ncbi:M48 family metallopeptidase [Rossellomorea aquimaris]|jgi:tetratricopeptide (TPR) repeat protein|uniref:Tetratricopeptide repeat protein n=1 Tax=Rossellomorea aquimaris TaxID=189382 RepID=A0A5D4UIH4_9BACI|nr:tetratricopeptide repeat protein [Rossellomorea aquimaris]TYS77842.1 tetratricopeptide repeat protein [Rossellomorea aquimaris]TYS87024.1 tetratricopeptide repeat protein [Rossellomorea aquimaris]
MTNGNHEGKGKIVQFPGLKDRLLEKGVQALEKGEVHESSQLLTQAYELEPDNPDINTALVLSLYESKQYDKARYICKEMLLEGIGDYFEVVDMYLMILIQLHQHREVVDTINALFDEKEVPFEKEEHFRKLLQFSEKVVNGKAQIPEEASEEDQSSILSGKSLEEQTLIVAQLVHRNIQPFIGELLSVLKEPAAHPFLQTMILNVLREHGMDKEVDVAKFEVKEQVSPSALEDVFESDFFRLVTDALDDLLAQTNPTLFQHAQELLKRHTFLLYPFTIEEDPKAIASVYAYYTAGMFADAILEEELKDQVENTQSQWILTRLKELEEISSPNI